MSVNEAKKILGAAWSLRDGGSLYNLKHLFRVAHDGFSDMVPALRAAFNQQRDDDKLDQVFGVRPRQRVLALSLVCILAGELFAIGTQNFEPNKYINWSAVCVAGVFAMLFRRFFFKIKKAEERDFPWLAATLIPATIALVLLALLQQFSSGSVEFLDDAPAWAGISAISLSVVRSLGVAAALAIAVAALCFSRNWMRALTDLAVQLLVFKIMVMVTKIVIIDISIVGRIMTALFGSLFGISFPVWIGDFADQLTLAVLLLIAYTAVIGGVWTACSQSFGTLLAQGDVSIMKTLKAMSEAPKKKKTEKKAAQPDK